MMGDYHVRFREGLGGKFPGSTRRTRAPEYGSVVELAVLRHYAWKLTTELPSVALVLCGMFFWRSGTTRGI